MITLVLPLAAAASLASCGSSPDPKPDGPSAPVAATSLSAEQQQVNLEGCMKRMEHYQQIGVWKHGGAKPGVARAAWDKLTENEQTEVFDVAGCIMASGQLGERIVTVAEEGNGPEMDTRRVANDRVFAVEVK
jgi:hypothetical protein